MFVVAALPLVAGCQSAPRACVGGTGPTDPADFVCSSSLDYRAFQALPTLRSLGTHVPRKPQTRDQQESLTPGDAQWTLVEDPSVSCSAEGHLELAYVAVGSGDFRTARNRLKITVAPGGRLLDPNAYKRMHALASTLDEALSLLRTKSCSEQGQPCELTRNPDPLRFDWPSLQYRVESEFQPIGKGAWFSFETAGQYRVMRAIFTTSDARFDVELRAETMDAPVQDGGTLHLVPEMLSREYDERFLGRTNEDGGGNHGG